MRGRVFCSAKPSYMPYCSLNSVRSFRSFSVTVLCELLGLGFFVDAYRLVARMYLAQEGSWV